MSVIATAVMADERPAYLTGPAPNSRQRPAAAIGALEGELRAAGLTRLYAASCARFAVLSVDYQVTVWTNGRLLWWRAAGEGVSWPAADPQGAVRQLVPLAPGTADKPGGAEAHGHPAV
jgi:hypothetical protein